MRKTFINTREALIVMSAYDQGEEWLGHPANTYETAAEVAHNLGDDNASAFYRVDLETMTMENVTEEIAAAYLALQQNGEITPENEDVVPVFVACSGAWDAFCEDFTPPMTEREQRREFGTYEANGRLA